MPEADLIPRGPTQSKQTTGKILVSACLIGERVRYHGGDAFCEHPILQNWWNQRLLVPLCPEVEAGFSIPRPPSEILGEGGGRAVLEGTAKVINRSGEPVTEKFLRGAQSMLQMAKRSKIRLAILKEGSPSCGTSQIYDGTFEGRKIQEAGVAAALLTKHGIRVFSECELREAKIYFEKVKE